MVNLSPEFYLSAKYKNSKIFQHRWAYRSTKLYMLVFAIVLLVFSVVGLISPLQNLPGNPALSDLHQLDTLQFIDAIAISAALALITSSFSLTIMLFLTKTWACIPVPHGPPLPFLARTNLLVTFLMRTLRIISPWVLFYVGSLFAYGLLLRHEILFFLWLAAYITLTIILFSKVTANLQYMLISLFISNGRPMEV
ncbi:MAG: hypothetical protein EOM12_18055 [Verrucomicrobiae bacterium]|nr:hypothetical protein [Verrucomicrobiae bacterium]